MGKQWGDPMIGVRLPAPVIKALRQMAYDETTTVSSILRDLVIAELKSKGYSLTEEPCDGQIGIE